MIRQNDNLEQTDFDTIAYDFVSLKEYSDNATAMSAQSTCEEMYLFQKLLRDKDIHRIDHRLKSVTLGIKTIILLFRHLIVD